MGVSGDRDTRVDHLLASTLDGPRRGTWLVAGVLPRVVEALRAGGADAVCWTRFATEAGPVATAEPVGRDFAGAVVRLPRGAEAARMTLHLVAGRLAPDGELWVGGANDEGIRSAERRLGEVLTELGPAEVGGHARVIGGRGPRPDLAVDLEDWVSVTEQSVEGTQRPWVSWPGLFAAGHLDAATALLLAHLPDPRDAVALDFGSGAGALAAALVARGAASVDASDHDALAIEAVRRNVPVARVHLASGLPETGGDWDLVVSNPPIHRGADLDWSVLERLAVTLPRRLRPGGAGWLVAQTTVPIRSLFAKTFPSVDVVAEDRSFRIWRLERRS